MAQKIELKNINKTDLLLPPNWEYRFETASVKGQRRFIAHSGFRTKNEAYAAGMLELQKYNNCGQLTSIKKKEISVADYLDLWFEKYCITQLKYNSQLSYRAIIDRHLKPHFGFYALSSLNAAAIQEYADTISLNGYSRSHIKGILSTLYEALTYAVHPLELLKSNPMEYVRFSDKNGRPKKERSPISKEDFNRLLERFPFGNRYHIPLLLGWYCGLRISEAFALTWEDVNFNDKTIRVNKQMLKRFFNADSEALLKLSEKSSEQAGWYFAEPKCDSARTIMIGNHLLDVLKKEKARQEECEAKYGNFYTVQMITTAEKDEKGHQLKRLVSAQKYLKSCLPRVNLICVDSNGQYTSTDSFRYASRVARLELGIFLDFHTLRHTHATILIENGVSPKVVQKRLGHKTITTTLQTYVHTTEKMEASAVSLFDDVVG